jgi:hypothetical protein
MADQPTQQPQVNPDAFSARMFDHDAGKWIDVPADKVQQAVLSGKMTFASGIKIPVVAPNGEVGTVDSDHAYDEFAKNGMQWLTPHAQQAFEQRQQERIQQENFGDQPLTAALAGVARMGTLGLSDVALDKAGLGDVTQQVEQRNPVASFGGEAVGTLLPGALGTVAAKGAGALAAGGVEAAEGAGLLGGAAATIAKPAAQFAAEGATYGLGSGISEQALGHPDDVLDNLISHVGAGALFGGATGGIFGSAEVARPYFDTLVEKAVGQGKTVVDKLATKVATKGIVAALTKSGQEDLAKMAPELANDPAFMRLYQEQGPSAIKKVVEENRQAIKEAKDLLGGLRSDLKSELKNAADGVKQTVTDAVEQAGGDIFKATQDAYATYRSAQETFDSLISGMQEPVSYDTSKLADRMEQLTTDLQESSNPVAKNLGHKLEAQLRSVDLGVQGGEAGFFYGLRQMLKNTNVEDLAAGERKAIQGIIDEADQSLLTHPNVAISKGYEAVKASEQALEHLQAVGDRTIFRITKTPLPGEQLAKGYTGASRVLDEAKMARTLTNPKTRELADAVFQNLDQFVPELKAYGQGLKTIGDRIAVQNQVEQKLSQILPKARVDGADVMDLLKLLGDPKDLAAKLDKIVDLQRGLQAGTSPMERVLAAKQALGQPISNDLKTIASMEQKFDLFHRMKDTEAPGFDLLKGIVGGSLTHAAKGLVFGLKKSNVGEYFNVLSSVQKASQRGADLLNKAIKGTAKALTGTAGQAAGKAYAYASTEGPSIKEQRKTYQQAKQQLMAYRPPEQHPLSGYAPQVTQAAQLRQQQIIQFLQSKLPQDPFQDNSLSLNKTGYMPSDHELASFSRYVRAANNPMQVIEHIRLNKATPEEVETLKTLNPAIYQKLQNAVLDSIIQKEADLSYKQKIQLSTLFDIPTDYSLRPDVIARLQQTLNKDQGGRPEGSGPAGKIQIDLKPQETVATEAQQVTYK